MNVASLILLAPLAVGAWLAFRRGLWRWAAGLAAAAVVPGWALLSSLTWPVLLIAVAVVAVLAWQRWARSAGIVARWSNRSRRKSGVASSTDIARRAGGLAMRLMAIKVRPSLAQLSRWQRLRTPLPAIAVELCRVGPQRVWASVEDVTLVFGGPRTGKTGWLAGRALDAPGAAVVTSTRTDLFELCAPIRERTHGPVWVFNPVGLGGIASTITFDPLTGCADPVTAGERATDMVTAATRAASGDAERWDAQARRVLAALLHAAALGGLSMAEVLGWVADNDRAAREVPALLRRSAVTAFERDATQFITTNDRTRTSITNSIMPALGWLNHPAAAAAAAPGAGFDVVELLAGRATVFLMGAEEAQTGPLVCALTGHIAREARRVAARMPGGRLDPPLTLALDEAALISPVPLENWTADMGGRGVTIIAAFQSRAQLLARYGEHKTATILNNTGSVVLFGGTRDRDDLQFWSALAGERDERITTTDLHGRVASRSVRKVAVFSGNRIANLPPGRVLVYRRGIDPVVGRAKMAWRRRDVRAHTAGYPTTAAAAGWAGRLAYTRHTTTRRAHRVGAAIGAAMHAAGAAATGTGLSGGGLGRLQAFAAVLAARARFWWGRLATATSRPRDRAPEPDTGHTPSAPPALRVISHRVDRELDPAPTPADQPHAVVLDCAAGPNGAAGEDVDPPTVPLEVPVSAFGRGAARATRGGDET